MTSDQRVIDQEQAQFGFVESIANNSISAFKTPKSNFEVKTTDQKDSDLIDIFIYHLIFYVVFCYSLFIYIFIDLGFISFLRNKVTTFININKKDEIPPLSQRLLINTDQA